MVAFVKDHAIGLVVVGPEAPLVDGLADSLRVHADSLRTRRRLRAEEAAAKIALKLLFPLIFFIFPSLLVVLMGPAMIQIYRIMLPSMAGAQ